MLVDLIEGEEETVVVLIGQEVGHPGVDALKQLVRKIEVEDN